MRRRTMLKCVAATVAAVHIPAEVPAVVADDREVWFVCETCERKLYGGDKAFIYSDGPAFCETHAPTWNDLKAEQDELIAAGEWGGLFADDEEASHAASNVERIIAEGRGAEAVAYVL